MAAVAAAVARQQTRGKRAGRKKKKTLDVVEMVGSYRTTRRTDTLVCRLSYNCNDTMSSSASDTHTVCSLGATCTAEIEFRQECAPNYSGDDDDDYDRDE